MQIRNEVCWENSQKDWCLRQRSRWSVETACKSHKRNADLVRRSEGSFTTTTSKAARFHRDIKLSVWDLRWNENVQNLLHIGQRNAYLVRRSERKTRRAMAKKTMPKTTWKGRSTTAHLVRQLFCTRSRICSRRAISRSSSSNSSMRRRSRVDMRRLPVRYWNNCDNTEVLRCCVKGSAVVGGGGLQCIISHSGQNGWRTDGTHDLWITVSGVAASPVRPAQLTSSSHKFWRPHGILL